MSTVPNLIPIIEMLKTVEHAGKLAMWETRIKSSGQTTDHHELYHECGTVHCVAGWYVVAKLAANPEHPLNNEEDIDYSAGVSMINLEIGGLRLDLWAEQNKKLWGNRYGLGIWANNHAWEKEYTYDGVISLTDVIQHLERVQKRIDAMQKGEIV